MENKLLITITFEKVGFNTVLKRVGAPKPLRKVLKPVPRIVKEWTLANCKPLREFILKETCEYLQDKKLNFKIENLKCKMLSHERFRVSFALASIDYDEIFNLISLMSQKSVNDKALSNLVQLSIDSIKRNVNEASMTKIAVDILNSIPSFLMRDISQFLHKQKIVAVISDINCKLDK